MCGCRLMTELVCVVASTIDRDTSDCRLTFSQLEEKRDKQSKSPTQWALIADIIFAVSRAEVDVVKRRKINYLWKQKERKAPATKNTLVDRRIVLATAQCLHVYVFREFYRVFACSGGIDRLATALVHESWKSTVPGAIKFHVVFERNRRWA